MCAASNLNADAGGRNDILRTRTTECYVTLVKHAQPTRYISTERSLAGSRRRIIAQHQLEITLYRQFTFLTAITFFTSLTSITSRHTRLQAWQWCDASFERHSDIGVRREWSWGAKAPAYDFHRARADVRKMCSPVASRGGVGQLREAGDLSWTRE